MNVSLNKIAKLFTGVMNGSFNKGVVIENQVDLLNANAINEYGSIDMEKLQPVSLKSEIKESFYLKEGDVVLIARGNAMRAAIVPCFKSKVIPSSNLIVIRPNKDNLVGEVLVNYLNANIGQSELVKITRGSTMLSISIKDLGELKIYLPSMIKQIQIKEIFITNIEAYQACIRLAKQQYKTSVACMLNLMEDKDNG